MGHLLVIRTAADVAIASAALTRARCYGLSVGLDVEADTESPKQPNQMKDTLVGVGVAVYDIDGNPELTFYGLWEFDPYREMLSTQLQGISWVAHNAMYDGTMLRRAGVHLGECDGDGRIIAYLLGEPEAGLKPLLQRYYEYDTLDFHELLDMHGAEKISDVPLERQAEYCGTQDAEQCVRLARDMEHDLDPRVAKVYRELELPMVNILMDMTEQGIHFDREAAAPMLARALTAKDGLDAAIAEMVVASGFQEYREKKDGTRYRPVCRGCRNGSKKRTTCTSCDGEGFGDEVPVEFNSGSPDQLRRFIYNHLGLPVRRWTGKMWRGKPVDPSTASASTDSLALLQLQHRSPVIPMILARRKFAKEAGFLEGWIAGSISDHKLHTTFTNTTVASGRLSSREPNLQQVQLHLRSLFQPDEGYDLLAADYSQLELRIMAFMSKDPVMIDILRHDPTTPEGDMHIRTGTIITGLGLHEITKAWRNTAKVVNYLTGYGGQADKCVEGIEKRVLLEPDSGLFIPTVEEAAEWLRAHRRGYAKYWQWVEWTILRTRQLGYSVTAFGRPRFFPDINSRDSEYRTSAERACVNHSIQGTAADLIKMAQRGISRDREMMSTGHMLLQVHDEIVAQSIKSATDVIWKPGLQRYMECGQPFLPDVSLAVDIAAGPNWGSCHK